MAVRITVEHEAPCLTCEERIHFGEVAWWERGVGIWHEDCDPPLNLELYKREAERRQQQPIKRADGD